MSELEIYRKSTFINLYQKRFFESLPNLEKNSIKGYKSRLNVFFKFLEQNRVTAPELKDLVLFTEYLKIKDYSVSSQQAFIQILKKYFKFLKEEGLYLNIAKTIRSPKSENTFKRDPLSLEEVERLIDYEVNNDNFIENRNKAIITLLLYTGMRISEITDIKFKDIGEKDRNRVVYIKRKNHAEKLPIILNEEWISTFFNPYLKLRGTGTEDDYIFVTNAKNSLGNLLKNEVISRFVKEKFRDLGIDSPKKTAHSLRHTVATNLLEQGVSLYKIRDLLGHSSITTTERYAKQRDRLKDAPEHYISYK